MDLLYAARGGSVNQHFRLDSLKYLKEWTDHFDVWHTLKNVNTVILNLFQDPIAIEYWIRSRRTKSGTPGQ